MPDLATTYANLKVQVYDLVQRADAMSAGTSGTWAKLEGLRLKIHALADQVKSPMPPDAGTLGVWVQVAQNFETEMGSLEHEYSLAHPIDTKAILAKIVYFMGKANTLIGQTQSKEAQFYYDLLGKLLDKAKATPVNNTVAWQLIQDELNKLAKSVLQLTFKTIYGSAPSVWDPNQGMAVPVSTPAQPGAAPVPAPTAPVPASTPTAPSLPSFPPFAVPLPSGGGVRVTPDGTLVAVEEEPKIPWWAWVGGAVGAWWLFRKVF